MKGYYQLFYHGVKGQKWGVPEGIAGIAIDDCPQRPGLWIGFNEPEIKSIEIVS